MSATEARQSLFQRVEWAVVLMIFLCCCVLHFNVLVNAGHLWRDEAASAAIAQTHSLDEKWELLRFESFPLAFHLSLHSWMTVMGKGDLALRLFGLLVGVSVLFALWFNSRTLGRSLPLISMAVFGMNSVAIRYGDSMRAYGMGILFMLLTVGFVWRLVNSPSRVVVALAALSAVVAVQSLYQNAFFVLAICTAGMMVTIRRRLWKRTMVILAVGAIAAISLLPYIPIINCAKQYLTLNQSNPGFGRALAVTAETLNSSGVFMGGTWLVLLIIGVGIAIAAQFPETFSLPVEKRDLALYGGVASAVSLFCFCIFWRTSKLEIFPYYILLPLSLLAVFLDAMVTVLPAVKLHRFLVLCLSTTIGVTCFPTVWRNSHMRHTNVGEIAAKLEVSAARDDLIVVIPWYVGTTFQRYYKGNTAWITIPELDNYEVQREDQFMRKLTAPDAVAPALEKIKRVLKAGQKVWLLCQADYVPRGPLPPTLPPALPPPPLGPQGWYAVPYLGRWAMETWHLLQRHALHDNIALIPTAAVSQSESLGLMVFEGWQ